MLALDVCFLQPCSSAGCTFSAYRSRSEGFLFLSKEYLNYHQTIGLFPQKRNRWKPCKLDSTENPRSLEKYPICLKLQPLIEWWLLYYLKQWLVLLLECLCRSNPCRFEFSVFWVFRNRTDDLRIDSPALWPIELVLHHLGWLIIASGSLPPAQFRLV